MFDPFKKLKNNLQKYINKETTKQNIIKVIQQSVNSLNIVEPLEVSISSTATGFIVEIDRAS